MNKKSWNASLIPLGSSIQDAISSLEISSMQIALVVSEGNKLEGTLTDGDIRRAFLSGGNLDTIVDGVMNNKPLIVPPEISREYVLQLMKINKIHQLPIVENNGVVIGLHLWNSIVAPTALENKMLIMAGGQGKRLRPFTENCPKPMLEIGGKPMLQHIIEKAKNNGFRNFLISLNYLGEVIENYFQDGSQFGVNIEYLHENKPLGTAGCLSLLMNCPNLPFVVTNGDVLTDINYREFLNFHIEHEALATMAVRQHEIQNQFGVVLTRGIQIEGFEEKPVYRSNINAGIYVLDPKALSFLDYEQHCDMPTLFNRIKNKVGAAIVYPMHETWVDVGRPDDLEKLRAI